VNGSGAVMNISCGVNGEPWTAENPLYLCHHCGMPVCLKHGRIIGTDEAFAAPERADDLAPIQKVDYRAAMHCPTCVRDHPGGRRAYSGGWIDQRIRDEANKENAKRDAAAAEAAAKGKS
jgi:hypothetical protein